MIDIVEIFKTHCTTLGYKFSYGNKANNNLLRSEFDNSQIYLLLDPVTRIKAKTEYGGLANVSFRGSFMLLVQSDLDTVYYDQKDTLVTDGKYETNIKPLLSNLEDLESLIDCSAYELTQWEILDVTDALDVNMDGLVVTFNVKIV